MFKNRAPFLECPSSVAIEVAPEAEFGSQFEGSQTVRSNSLKLIYDDFKTNCKPASDIIKCWASSKHFLTTNLIQLIPEVSHDHGDAEDDDDTRIISLPQRASLSVWLEENGRTRKEWEKEMEWENEMEREREWEIKWERRRTGTAC